MPNTTIIWEEYQDIDLDWIRRHHSQSSPGMVAKKIDIEEPHLAPFVHMLHDIFKQRLYIAQLYVAHLDHECVNENDHDWCYGFPHNHNNDFLSCSVVLQAPEMGGATMLEDENGERTSYKAIPGRGLIIRGDQTHGVARVYGDIPRIAVIAQFALL